MPERPKSGDLVRQAEALRLGQKLGIGKQPIPPRPETQGRPLPPPRAVPMAVQHEREPKIPGSPAPPASGSYEQRAEPKRSLSPPDSAAFKLKMGDNELKVGKTFASKLKGWIVPLIVSAAGWLALAGWGYLKGYWAGMTKAADDFKRLEVRVEDLREEALKRWEKQKIVNKSVEDAVGRLDTVMSDHEARLNRQKLDESNLERRVTAVEQKAIVVK